MTAELLSTKLHRPDPPEGWIERGVPFARLEEGNQAPLTLVSAPAGYGKSVTVAAWLASREEPSAWLSLDADDSDAGDFLSYLLAAVRKLFPDACPETEKLLHVVAPPPVSVLARSLANELDPIERPFFLVLDDYHALEGSAVHNCSPSCWSILREPSTWCSSRGAIRRCPSPPCAPEVTCARCVPGSSSSADQNPTASWPGPRASTWASVRSRTCTT